MSTVNIYLSFLGNCQEAFDFYKSVFGGEFSMVNRYSEMPPQEGMHAVPDEMKDYILHISLPISAETVLMGSDTGGPWAADWTQGNNFTISVLPDSKEDGERIFNALAEGGVVTMPYSYSFWGAWFGSLKDKFGINWMVNLPGQE
ncbi:MAG: VOC family protein [Bacteroidia bacterium]